MIGEHLVEQALEDDPTVLDRALETHTEHALTVLTRLAKRRPDAIRWLEHAFANDLERLTEPAIKVATESGDPIGQVLARVLEQRPLEDPSRFEALVPYPTTALREVGAAVLEQMMQTVLLTPQPWSEYVKSEVARISNNLVGRLSDLNRHEEALATDRQALAVYRELAATRPEEFQPEVARSLDNM